MIGQFRPLPLYAYHIGAMEIQDHDGKKTKQTLKSKSKSQVTRDPLLLDFNW